jgi:hypothetical protein
MKKMLLLFGILAVSALAAACSDSADAPAAPSPATSAQTSAASADGSTLKATAPAPYAPANASNVTSLTPNLVVANSTLKYLGDVPTVGALSYRFIVETPSGTAVANFVEPTAGGNYAQIGITGARVPDKLLQPATTYRWRARAELGSSFGPWSGYWTFTTPAAGPAVDVARTISITEAVSIIRKIYSDLRYNLGSSSTREERNVYLQRAVAALHFGHARFNPQGRDPNWCIKNGGPGRPQADDVIVRCDSRDAWDLVVSIGADSYSWHTDYIGRLPSEQAVYPPPRSALDALPY